MTGPLVGADQVPAWMAGLLARASAVDPTAFLRAVPRPAGVDTRSAAVLMLFGESDWGPDLLLLRRADSLNSHPGQVAFPGGVADEDDDGPVATALREATEEVGVLPAGVLPVALLPSIYVPVSFYQVTPVLAYWSEPSAVYAVDQAETAAVARVPVVELADPANRFRVRHESGYVGPAFGVPGMVVWGFTGALVSMLLAMGGWEQPWDATDVRDLDEAWRAARQTEVPG
jgi:8-oxo-dGTP pyrophosphatase MutT (NUDIX family)